MGRHTNIRNTFFEMFHTECPFANMREFSDMISRISGLESGTTYTYLSLILNGKKTPNERFWEYMNTVIEMKAKGSSEEEIMETREVLRQQLRATSVEMKMVASFLTKPDYHLMVRHIVGSPTPLSEENIVFLLQIPHMQLSEETITVIIKDLLSKQS